jgi:hypothetical protein
MSRHPFTRSRVAGLAVMATAAVLLLAGCTPAHKNPVATFEVAGVETYKIELDTPALVKHAEQLLKGENVAAIPLGRVVRDSPGVNKPWSWHIDPKTLQFAEITIEVCDGLPSYVEDRTVTSKDYCPWSAKVIKIDK